MAKCITYQTFNEAYSRATANMDARKEPKVEKSYSHEMRKKYDEDMEIILSSWALDLHHCPFFSALKYMGRA